MVGITDFLAPIGDIGGAIVSGLFNAHQADKNRDWQEWMSSSSHQREVADLRAAGLNPILSAGGGGASTPSGSSATMPGSSPGTSWSNARVARAQELVQKQTAELIGQQIGKTAQEEATSFALEQNYKADTENKMLLGLQTKAQTLLTEAQEENTKWATQMTQANVLNIMQQTMQSQAYQELLKAQARMTRANASQAEVQKAMYEAALPLVNAIKDRVMQYSNNAKDSVLNATSFGDFAWRMLDALGIQTNHARNQK